MERVPSHPTRWGWGFDPSPPKRFRGLPHSPALSRTSVEGSESPQTPPKNTSTKHEALPMNPPPPEYGARGICTAGLLGRVSKTYHGGQSSDSGGRETQSDTAIRRTGRWWETGRRGEESEGRGRSHSGLRVINVETDDTCQGTVKYPPGKP